jgi:HSP20 family protein
MTNLIHWYPYRDMSHFRRAMSSMFDDATLAKEFDGSQDALWELPLDVIEDKDDYTVKASLPGINPADLDVTYNNNTLTIRGEIKAEEDKKEQHYHLRERAYGSFSRSVYLPNEVNANAIEAKYEAGILTLTLPKAEEVKPKKINVKVTESN